MPAPAIPMSVDVFLGNIESFFTWCFERVTDIFTFIVGSAPMTIICFGFLIVGFTVSLVRRLISL